MSVGRVINGKLAVRNGRLSCDCCGDQPPPPPQGGCLPCGVAPSGFNNWTAHFQDCIARRTPGNAPIVLPGESPQVFGTNYETQGWNAPLVQLSGSMTQDAFRQSNGNLTQYTCVIPFGTFLRVRRNPLCMTFAEYRPEDGDPFFSTRTRIPYRFTSTGQDPFFGEMDVSSGQIQLAHNYGFPNQSQVSCNQLPENDGFNLRLFFNPFGQFGLEGAYEFYASTGNQYPCYGQGFTESTARAFPSLNIQSSGVSMSGSCSSFSVFWQGARVIPGTLEYTFTWSVQATFINMDTCPEDLIV